MKFSVDSSFSNKNLLITGTTGFVGKALLEKLLRDVPSVQRIFVLVRPGKGEQTAQQRFETEILSSSVFNELRRLDPQGLAQLVSNKLRVVSGEVTLPDFGLGADEFERLARNVDAVINVAASVEFRGELDKSLDINTLCLRHIGKLVEMAGHVPLVHVSTCYVNGFHPGTIEEDLQAPARMPLQANAEGHFDVDRLVDDLQQKVAELKNGGHAPQVLTRALIDLGIQEAQKAGWNDTYTYTKWLGEQVACAATRHGSLAIVRPSIIESAITDPVPGWIEGMKVGDAIIMAYAKGKTKIFPAKTRATIDIVPVDLVVNGIILAGAEALAHPGQRRIYQVSSSTRNPIRLGDYIQLCQSEMHGNSAAYPGLIQRPLKSPFRTVSRRVFLTYLAAAHGMMKLAQLGSRLLGRNDFEAQCKALDTTRELATMFSFYTSPNYVFCNRKLMHLATRVTEAERLRFAVDPRCIDWTHYVKRVHLPGLEQFAVRPLKNA
ncbi:MAG: SDR family oxidoreductase [Burkholderiaceae bacterium]|nr:SDR family oxidoreductase [Roseateles sp.]MBV8469457.1 SDR family oxidoreductase [Burkholderiaceae bacterium]